jgi:hypothetical protein
MATLSNWFIKHPPIFSDKYAVKCMHKKIEMIEKKLKENPDDPTYLADLAKVMQMLYDFFEEKGVNPQTLL